ncbi:MAG: hypothetical protein AABY22_00150 [Nanoarchaeota archaeon]
MIEEKYNEIQDLKERIAQLDIVKKHMIGLFSNKPFRVKIKTEVFGHISEDVIPFLNSKIETESHRLNNEDSEYILKSIDDKTDELKLKFESL